MLILHKFKLNFIIHVFLFFFGQGKSKLERQKCNDTRKDCTLWIKWCKKKCDFFKAKSILDYRKEKTYAPIMGQ